MVFFFFNELQFVMLEDVTSLIFPLRLAENVLRTVETIASDVRTREEHLRESRSGPNTSRDTRESS